MRTNRITILLLGAMLAPLPILGFQGTIVPAIPHSNKLSVYNDAASLLNKPLHETHVVANENRVPEFTSSCKSSITFARIGFGLMKYTASISLINRSTPWSPKWFFSLTAMLFASYSIASSALPLVHHSLKLDNKEDFVLIFGAHIASLSALPILTSLLWAHVASKKVLLLSMLSMTVGNIAENVGHFRDGWVFRRGGNSEIGIENILFSIGLNMSFGLLFASFFERHIFFFVGLLPAAALIPFVHKWKSSKTIVYGSQFASSAIAMAALMKEFHSPWPLIFFVQSFNIIRNAGRLLDTEIQALHFLPSLYGWISYVFPSTLAISAKGVGMSQQVPTVFLMGIASFLTTDLIERKIIEMTYTY